MTQKNKNHPTNSGSFRIRRYGSKYGIARDGAVSSIPRSQSRPQMKCCIPCIGFRKPHVLNLNRQYPRCLRLQIVGGKQISGLVKGAAYHVRVSTYNGVSLSYGKTRPSTPPVSYPGDVPEPPSRLEVEAFSPTSLAISWSPPNDNMGLGVLSYHVVST